MDFVNQAWDPGIGECNLSTMAASLSALQSSLRSWDRDVFGSVRLKLKNLREQLEEERGHTLYRGPTDREKRLMTELS